MGKTHMQVTIPSELKTEYPFQDNFLDLPNDLKYHYVAEGEDQARPVMMVHGNPTWSFFYRNIIKLLKSTHRVIVPDHIGCGLSDKPQDYDYTLENHIQNLEELFKKEVLPSLKANNHKLDLIVHDWGGAIGMGLATRYPEYIGKVVIMNTAAFTDIHMPTRIGICKLPVVGERIVRHFNAFAWPATFMAVAKPLSNEIKKGFLLPYNNYKNRIATARFVKDIPMNAGHPTWRTLKSIENKLPEVKGEKLLLWGEKDFCFTPHFFERWTQIYPEAKQVMLPSAGHYLLEDEPQITQKTISDFLQ